MGDGDKAGRATSQAVATHCIPRRGEVATVALPGEIDPDSLSLAQIREFVPNYAFSLDPARLTNELFWIRLA